MFSSFCSGFLQFCIYFWWVFFFLFIFSYIFVLNWVCISLSRRYNDLLKNRKKKDIMKPKRKKKLRIEHKIMVFQSFDTFVYKFSPSFIFGSLFFFFSNMKYLRIKNKSLNRIIKLKVIVNSFWLLNFSNNYAFI